MLLDFRNVSARAPLSQAGRAGNGIITMIVNFIWMLVEFKIYIIAEELIMPALAKFHLPMKQFPKLCIRHHQAKT